MNVTRSLSTMAAFCGLALSMGLLQVEAQVKTVELTISGTPEPVPPLRYRLLHNHAELKPGDAAPVYLRINAGMGPESVKEFKAPLPSEWFSGPIDEKAHSKIRGFVNRWALSLQQIEFAAARRDCSWDYTIEEQRENVFEVLLPDAVPMKDWNRILILKARAEIYEKRYEEAANTMRTSIAFARHVAQGPFSINGLVAVTNMRGVCIILEDWISKPDSPNLYWALTALPRPILSMRNAFEQEFILPKMMIPEMVVGSDPLTIAEWDARLARLHKRLIDMRNKPGSFWVAPEIAEKSKNSLGDYRSWILPEARKYAASHPEMKYECESQLIVTYIWLRYQELYDDLFKAYYLPLPVSEPFYRDAMVNLQKSSKGPLWFLHSMLGNVEGMYHSEAHLEHRIALLRVIEALRLHLKTNPKPPATLAELTVVPVPVDPWTGEAFDYEVKDNVIRVGNFKSQSGYNYSYKIAIKQAP